MTNIMQIPDMKNYTEVLSSCDDGSVVLLADLSKGIESLRTEGGLTIEEAFEGLEE